MKIIVLHGDDSAKSYDRLMKFINTAKQRGWEIITDQFPNTPSLFGTERLVIFRDYKLLAKNDIKNFGRFEGTLVIYHDAILPQTFLKLMPAESKMEKFELPKALWKFLDNITVKNLHEVIKHEPVEFVFAMIVWKMKQKYKQSLPSSEISAIISQLAEIDIKVKTSKSDLLTELDLFIVKHLE